MSTHEIASDPVEIAAPASLVWDILTDLMSYRQWNPLNARIESTLKLGDPVTLWVTDPIVMETVQVFVHTLVAYEHGRRLAWEWKEEPPADLRTRRDQFVEATGPESCSYYTTDTFYGSGADALFDLYGAGVKKSFESVGQALKRHAERMHREQS